MTAFFRLSLALLLLSGASAARADDDESAAFWITPSLGFEVDDDTEVELETSLRLRSAAAGADAYLARLWLNQDVSDMISLSAGIERRVNSGPTANEVRLLQQVALESGVLRARVRVEQRFIDRADQMALRVRPRIGVSVPVDADGRWQAVADAEVGFTLQAARFGGQTGVTGIRTRIGGNHELTERMKVGLFYVRNQEVIKGRSDRVTHAPLITLAFGF